MQPVNYREISDEEAGQRLDNYLISLLKGVPKSRIYRMIRSGEVRVNKRRVTVATRIQAKDSIRIPPVRCSEVAPVFVSDVMEKTLMDAILYEDKSLLIVNKPAGIAVHGGSGLSLGIIEAYRTMGAHGTYLELAHRLDRDTSGCLVIAKKRSALRALHEEFSKQCVKKVYHALLAYPWQHAVMKTVDAPLLKGVQISGERHVVVHPTGKASKTTFHLLKNYEDAALVEALPETGRTHQIRVHSAYLGHPILGDQKYGAPCCEKLWASHRALYLHAMQIEFQFNDKLHCYEAPYDEGFRNAIRYFSHKENI